ncbi:MAG: cupin domain-containing protein [Thermodesulfobacteriota bacterium]
MKLVKKNQGQSPKAAKRHFMQSGVTKVSDEDGTTKRLHVSVSHFLPGGGSEIYASPTERIYFGMSGTLLVKGKAGDEYLLEEGDVLYLPPGEERSISTVGNSPATMLVVIVKLD